MNFSEIFNNLCKENKTTMTATVKELGLAPGSVTAWKQGKEPKVKALLLISHRFGVSIDYLLGNSEEKENPSDEPKAAIIPFNENEEKLLECFRACDLEGQIKILNTAIEQRDAREKITRSKTTTNA